MGAKLKVAGWLAVGAVAGALTTMQLQATARNGVAQLPLEELQQMARQLMDKVKTTGAPQEVGPLNPYARRIVHLTVAEDALLASASTGDSFLKTVVISKKQD